MHNLWFLFLFNSLPKKVSKKKVIYKISSSLGKDGISCTKGGWSDERGTKSACV